MKPLLSQRHELPFKAVLLRCLDENRKPIPRATASGFIRRENGCEYLYTCWHVVTGYDRNDVRVTSSLPNRAFLEVHMQDAQAPTSAITVIGGLQSFTVPLYDDSSFPKKKPIWFQDDRHSPNPDLNSINLFVPFWHDAVRIAIPDGVRIAEVQRVDADVFPSDTMLVTGDKLYVVGFPYGFSTYGAQQPTPVVLTRFLASTSIGDRKQEILLESAGAPGMSGGPVLVERDSSIYLLGLYTGLIYPDHVIERNERVTALGTCSNMTLCWRGGLDLVKSPSEAS